MATKKPGGITPTGDAENQRVKGISDVAKTVNTMRRRVDSEIDQTERQIDSNKQIQEIQSSMNSVLKRLGDTVGALSSGVTNITLTTAKATKDAVAQYGKAIGEDVNWNKQNLIASTLAKSTPIFGYFAAKFMETDVFKQAAMKMRESVGKVFSGIGSWFKNRKSGKGEKDDGIPHMAKGGYVEKGGLAKLHPAEVVMPIDELLSRLDESLSTTKQLSIVAKKAQLAALGNMKTYVAGSEEKSKIGIAKGFLRAYSEVNSQYLEPDSKRQLRATLAIQDALGAQIGAWKQVWQKMLIEHPLFRNMMFLAKTFYKVIGSPVKLVYSLLKDRGGYGSMLSHDSNPMKATAQNIGAYAVESLWRLDLIVAYTRATAEASRDLSTHQTGKKYKKVGDLDAGYWKISNILTWPARFIYKQMFRRYLIKPLEKLVRDIIMGKNGDKRKGLADFLTTEEGLMSKVNLLPGRWRHRREALLGSGLEATDEENPDLVKGKLYKKIEPWIDKFYIKGAKYFGARVDLEGLSKRQRKKEIKLIEYQADTLGEMNRREKRKSFFAIFAMIGSFLKETFKTLLSPITSLFSTGFFKALKGGATAFATFITPLIPIILAALAGSAIGLGIGNLINEKIITPLREKLFKEINEKTDKAKAERGKVDKEFWDLKAKVDSGKATSAEEAKMRAMGKMQGDISGKLAEMRKKRIGGKAFGYGEMGVYQAVTDAQMKYFSDNYDQYAAYSDAEIEKRRAEWLELGGGGPVQINSDYVEAGKRREAAFLRFLKGRGKPKYETDPTLMDKGRAMLQEGKGKVTELAMEAIDATKTMKDQALQDLKTLNMQTEALAKNITKLGKEYVQAGKEGAIIVSNSVSNAISSSNKVVNGAGNTAAMKRLKDVDMDLTSNILYGRMK